jgi:hypothetical protein
MTYMFPSTSTSLLPEAIWNYHPIRIIINYQDALKILSNNTGIDNDCESEEIKEILKHLVLCHFSKNSYYPSQKPKERYLNRLLMNNYYSSFEDFENSEVAYLANSSIVRTTAIYLPRFKSHEESHCSSILDMEMRGDSNLLMSLDAGAFKRFANADG